MSTPERLVGTIKHLRLCLRKIKAIIRSATNYFMLVRLITRRRCSHSAAQNIEQLTSLLEPNLCSSDTKLVLPSQLLVELTFVETILHTILKHTALLGQIQRVSLILPPSLPSSSFLPFPLTISTPLFPSLRSRSRKSS